VRAWEQKNYEMNKCLSLVHLTRRRHGTMELEFNFCLPDDPFGIHWSSR
jgi:hypothetical protein